MGVGHRLGYGGVKGLRKALDRVVDLIWPARSLLSERVVAAPGAIEPELWARLAFLGPPWCARCGFPFKTPEPPGSLCPACIADPPAYDAARAALRYDDVSRPLALDLKRGGRRDGLPTFAAWMRLAGAELIAEADVIVPVPLHWTRLAQRRFNQAQWLAAAVARASDKPLASALLVRKKRARSQGGLSARQRALNVRGAFVVPSRREARLAGRAVLLIDDVFTTGATIEACARALKRAGARTVMALTLARVVRPGDATI